MELYRKYRPKNLKQMFGNETTLKTIKKMEDNFPHSILLTGPKGTGKTTLGRIIRKMLDCGDFDFTELDTVSFGGIDVFRDIRKQLPYAPKSGESKVYLLDEAHEMTSKAQGSLLKALEEAPEHVYFILCTTNPEKLLDTVKSRCTTFSMETLSDDDMFKLISKVCKKEKKKLPEEVIYEIVDSSEGHPRNALTLLEKVIVLSDKKDMLKIASQRLLDGTTKDLCQKLLKGTNWKEISKILESIKDEPSETIRKSILNYMKSVLINSKKGNNNAWLIMSWFYEKNTFDSGFAGIVFCCYGIVNNFEGPY